jgi:hypothetical protein
MKGYGVPRKLDIEFPDLLDICRYGLKTSTGQIVSKGGDCRGSSKTKNRNKARCTQLKQARSAAKLNIRDLL